MGNRRSRARLVCIIGILVTATAAAAGAYDLSGKWAVVSPSGHLSAHWDVAQSAGDLAVTMSNFPPPGTVPGTIDEGTGAFTIYQPQVFPGCGPSRFADHDQLQGSLSPIAAASS